MSVLYYTYGNENQPVAAALNEFQMWTVTVSEPGNSSKVEIYHQNYVALNGVKHLALSRVSPNGAVISKLVEYFELVNK